MLAMFGSHSTGSPVMYHCRRTKGDTDDQPALNLNRQQSLVQNLIAIAVSRTLHLNCNDQHNLTITVHMHANVLSKWSMITVEYFYYIHMTNTLTSIMSLNQLRLHDVRVFLSHIYTGKGLFAILLSMSFTVSVYNTTQ